MAEAAPLEVTERSPERKRASKERGIDDYKRKIWKLKKELEEQRELSLSVQNDELEKVKQSMLLEKEKALEDLKLETRKDLLSMRNAFADKEAELGRIIKRHETDNKTLKQQVTGHADEVMGVKAAIESAHQDTVTKLQREIKQLKHINQDLQQKYQTKQQDYRDKVSELKTVQEEAETERRKLMNDALIVKLNRLKRDQDSSANSTKERDLQHRVSDQTMLLKRLEKRCELLKEENLNLKKTESSYKELEEHCAKLKRRNAELATTVKSTGEKNKLLQVSSKKSAETAEAAQGVDHAKKLFARQRAKDFAEHSKVLLNKDKEIEKLTKKLLALSDNMSNQTREQTVRSQLDMSTALRQGTKERMILEMKSNGPTATDSNDSQATLFNMQVDYDTLQDKCEGLTEERNKLQRELEEFRSRLGEVEQELGRLKKEKITLQGEYDIAHRKCVQLTATNNSVTKERDHLTDTVDKLTEEISLLKHENKSCQRTIDKLSEKNKDLSKSLEVRDNNQRQYLESNIETLTEQLESVKSQLRAHTSENNQLREDNSVASNRITELLDKNQNLKSQLNELNHSTIPTLREQSDELKTSVKQLELRNGDLKEEKDELQTQFNNLEDVTSLYETAKLQTLSLTEELSEMKELLEKEQKQTAKARADHQTKIETLTAELQYANGEKADLEQNRTEAQRRIEVLKDDCKQILGIKDDEIAALKKLNIDLEQTISEQDVRLNEVTSQLKDAEEQISLLQTDLSRELSNHNTELESLNLLQDRLDTTSAQIKQLKSTNQELEGKVSEFETASQIKDSEISRYTKENESLEQSLRELELSRQEKSEKFMEITRALEERELDLESKTSLANDLGKSLHAVKSEKQSLVSESESLKQLVTQRESEKNDLSSQISKLARELDNLQSSHLEYSNLANSKQTQHEAAVAEVDELENKLSSLKRDLETNEQSLSDAKKQETSAKKKLISLKQDLTTSYEAKLNKLNGTLDHSEKSNKELKLQLDLVRAELEEQSVKQISVFAGDNCYHLYVARHAYDPSLLSDSNESPLSSPNKSADRSGADSALSATERISDISVNPGDYVFVSGELTEEGYYEGHLLDGRAGLIPSNVLEPLYEFDIYGFVLAPEPIDDPEECSQEMSGFSSTMFNDSSLLPSTPRPLAPFPQNLALDRQFSSGILVGWDAPEGLDRVFVYKVYIDGKFRVSLNGRSKCKALIEGVKSAQPHRVCVTATTSIGESDRRHCTIVIGEPHRPPSELTVNATNSETAHISFLPHNSNHHHFISVNGEKVRNLAPSLFQVDIAGLLPQTDYYITVTACDNPDQSLTPRSSSKKPLSVSIEFKMPSADELTDKNGSHLEPGFLQKFDQFLDVIANGSPTPASIISEEVEPGLDNADFLKNYDAALANGNGHATSAYSPSTVISHSTPKYLNKIILGKAQIEDNFSPIVLDLDQETSPKHPTPTINDKSNSESTATLGASDLTPVNSSKPVDLVDNSGKSLSASLAGIRHDRNRDNGVKSPSKSRASPLQNKHSLHKMIKSLASKEKSRSVKNKSEGGTDEIDSTPRSARNRTRSGEKAARIKKSSPPDASNDISADQSPRSVSDAIQNDPRLQNIAAVRSFRALYDYEPALMSPNKDTIHEELGFQTGDIINIYGDVDTDGFYLGEMDGKRGYVPSNLVEEFKFSDKLKSGERRMTALYDYDPSKKSPNKDCERELAFHAGDIIIVNGKMDHDGFYHGHVSGGRDRLGLVPSNFLKEIKSS